MNVRRVFALKGMSRPVAVCLLLLCAQSPACAGSSGAFSFENEDIQVVIKEVSRLTGVTFLFDPAQVRGRITLIGPGSVSPAEALGLLKSTLALHGYALVRKPEGAWIVAAERARHEDVSLTVVPLRYARADEVASALSWVAPPWIGIVPYRPTNSVIISGPWRAVEELSRIITGEAERQP